VDDFYASGRVDLAASSAPWSITRGSSPRPSSSPPPPRARSHDVLGPRLERIELDRAALAGPRALRRADLVARNIHHSVINAIKAFGLDFRFLPRPTSRASRPSCPPSADDVLDGLARYPEALAVLYTSPTYEGLAANTRAIARAVHTASDQAMVIVDEAWGGPSAFPPRPARERHGVGGRHLCSVDPQARRRPAADRPDPLRTGRVTPS
jgi:hypothetical protein